ncbi:MAG TPA: biotin-dependent carboxyltransferase family protein [Candidatus Limnocylindrales bacterium]
MSSQPGREVREVLEVLDGGLQATIQDGGRRGHEAEGVPRSGAADAVGLAVANLLLGNRPDAAALEATIIGLRVRAVVPVDVALGGADLGAIVEPDTPVRPGTSIRLAAGHVLAVSGRPDGDGPACRAYLAVPGGFDVPVVLGSRSTCLPAGFGGLEGRALRAGDRLRAAGGAAGLRTAPRRLGSQAAANLPSAAQRLRVLPGPASGEGDPAFAGLVSRPWVVAAASDRRGLRLEPADPGAGGHGPSLAPLAAGELPSLGVLPGAIQVTPSGQPLVLMPDSGTTGGYPVVAVVIQADLPLLGQLDPGAEVRFRATTADDARAAAIERRALIASIGSGLS